MCTPRPRGFPPLVLLLVLGVFLSGGVNLRKVLVLVVLLVLLLASSSTPGGVVVIV